MFENDLRGKCISNVTIEILLFDEWHGLSLKGFYNPKTKMIGL
jgi:hypothetical protein